MRINRLRLRAQQAAIRAAQIKEAKVLQSAISNLTETVTNMQAEVIAKQTGVAIPPAVTQDEGKAIQDKIIDIREDVAEIQAEVTAPITPQEARERAADLLADANAAEAGKKP